MGRLRAAPSRIASLAPRVSVPAKVADPFYETASWRALARALKEQRGWLCEMPECQRDCRSNPRTLIADHIIERSDGGADLDPANIMLMCLPCHNRKTVRARVRRLRSSS
jgi:5-methylcytosine-specific restriction endonuclease McrA